MSKPSTHSKSRNDFTADHADRRGVISACTWALDRIKLVDQWPQEEHLARIIATDQQGGGCGYNLGVDIRKLDSTIPVEAIGLVGRDLDGQYLLDQATGAGIDITQLKQIDNVQTSFTDVFTVTDTGRRTFFHHTGSSDHITPDHFDFDLCQARILHLGLLGVHAKMDAPWYDEPNGWVSVLKSANHYGIHANLELVSIAPEKIREIALPCIPYINSLIVNEYELSALTNIDLCSSDNHIDESLFSKAAKKLFDISNKGPLNLVVAHCPSIAYAMSSDGTIYRRKCFNIDPTQIISAVGAGDAFAAGMLYGIHEQWDLTQSLELAHAAAAASLRSPTTVDSVESVDACLEFARAYGATTT